MYNPRWLDDVPNLTIIIGKTSIYLDGCPYNSTCKYMWSSLNTRNVLHPFHIPHYSKSTVGWKVSVSHFRTRGPQGVGFKSTLLCPSFTDRSPGWSKWAEAKFKFSSSLDQPWYSVRSLMYLTSDRSSQCLFDYHHRVQLPLANEEPAL